MIKNLLTLAGAACLVAAPLTLVAGGEDAPVVEKKVVVALSTDDFNLAETDISSLEPGDSETIITDSGKTIDILKTLDGVEIYIDGELLETGLEDMDHVVHVAPGDHTMMKHFEVICESDDDCEKMVMVAPHADLDYEVLTDAHGDVDVNVVVESLHEWTDDEDARVIVIQKKKYVEEY